MNKYVIVIVLLITAIGVPTAERLVLHPFERGESLSASNRIGSLVLAKLSKEGIVPANICSDETHLY